MIMKTVRYTSAAAASLRRIGAQDRAALIADLEAYAAGDAGFTDAVSALGGVDASRLGSGVYRVIFRESATRITVLAIGHRGGVYRRYSKRR